MRMIDQHIADAEHLADLRLAEHRWTAFAAWKTVAAALKKLKKELAKVSDQDAG